MIEVIQPNFTEFKLDVISFDDAHQSYFAHQVTRNIVQTSR